MPTPFAVTYQGTPADSTEMQSRILVQKTGRSLPVAIVDKLATSLEAIDVACRLLEEDSEELAGILEDGNALVVGVLTWLGAEPDSQQLSEEPARLAGILAPLLAEMVETYRAGPATPPDHVEALAPVTLPNYTTRIGNA
jgi:hypothetical protein